MAQNPTPRPPPSSPGGSTTVAVLGCGWLGLPVAERLVASGYAVRGSTTTPGTLPALASIGVEPVQVDLDTVEPDALASWCRVGALVVTVPPGGVSDYPASMERVGAAARAAGTGRVVFTSSTSVYPDRDGLVTEADAGPSPEAGLGGRARAVWGAEEALREAVGDRLVVLRLAGLVGGGREPGRFLAGRTGAARPEAPVNLVHQRDAVEAVVRALDAAPGAYSVAASGHPTRRAFYTAEAQRLGLDPPAFADEHGGGKTVSARAFSDATGWRATWRPGDAVSPSG